MSHPGRDLIAKLDELRKRLNDSGVQRTNAILGGMGEDCSYYRKSLNLFLEEDYEDLKSQMHDIITIMEKLDGR